MKGALRRGPAPGLRSRVAAAVALVLTVTAPGPEAFGGKTVLGQITVARATKPGHVVAYPSADGRPGTGGSAERSNLLR